MRWLLKTFAGIFKMRRPPSLGPWQLVIRGRERSPYANRLWLNVVCQLIVSLASYIAIAMFF